jgi:putative flippase GtrA
MRRWLTLLRSSAVGALSTAVDFASLTILVQALGLSPEQANVPALLLGLVCQFFGNKHFAFQDHSRDHVHQGARFVLVEAGAFVLNALAFHFVVSATAIPYLVARGLSTSLVYFGFSYPLWRRIFSPRLAPSGRPAGTSIADPSRDAPLSLRAARGRTRA